MAIPIELQFFVEERRNNDYSWGMLGGLLAAFALYGVLFNLAPRLVRRNRDTSPKLYTRYTSFLRHWGFLNSSFRIRTRWTPIYIQPNLVFVLLVYILWLIMMAWNRTADINYEPRYYIVGKKLSKVSVGNMPLLLLFISKNDVLTRVTGWPAHRLNLLHRGMGLVIYGMIIAHFILCATYWIRLDFIIMLQIPPQIFGMIAFGCMSMLTLLSFGIVRRLSYEFFLFNHGLLSGIMMLMAFFHNPGGRAAIILAVHAVVLDRIVAAFRSFMNRRCAKIADYQADFEILDKDIIMLSIPLEKKTLGFSKGPSLTFGSWKPGQHFYVRVGKARRIQWHPFTIASTEEDGKVVIIMRVYKGFTKALLKKIGKQCDENETSVAHFKTLLHGPYGGNYAALENFDGVIFASGGTGGSFTFPVALDLMRKITTPGATHRCSRIKFVWYIRKSEDMEWYKDSLSKMKEIVSEESSISILIEIYVTRPDATLRDSIEITEELKRVGSGSSLISYKTERPDAYSLIESEIAEQCKLFGEDNMKDIAVLGCGPARLVDEVAFECERQERRNKGLYVYQYMERYTV